MSTKNDLRSIVACASPTQNRIAQQAPSGFLLVPITPRWQNTRIFFIAASRVSKNTRVPRVPVFSGCTYSASGVLQFSDYHLVRPPPFWVVKKTKSPICWHCSRIRDHFSIYKWKVRSKYLFWPLCPALLFWVCGNIRQKMRGSHYILKTLFEPAIFCCNVCPEFSILANRGWFAANAKLYTQSAISRNIGV